MTGQVALEQLEQTTKRQDMIRAAEGNNFVRTSWELEAILAKFYEDQGIHPPKEPQRESLTRLLAALKATDSDGNFQIKGLAKRLEWLGKSATRLLAASTDGGRA